MSGQACCDTHGKISAERASRIKREVCGGCHHDFYNRAASAYSEQELARKRRIGEAILPEGHHCWSMHSVNLRRKQNRCRSYHS
jgi:hypothetical protein